MSSDEGPSDEGPSEEELRAMDAELSRLRLDDVLLENAVTIVNLAFRRSGLAPGTEGERDPEQVRLGIDALSALMPVLERVAPEQALHALRDALSRLQLAFVRLTGAGVPGPSPGAEPGQAPDPAQPPGPGGSAEAPAGQDRPQPEPKPGEPGPAQRAGRLWVPGS